MIIKPLIAGGFIILDKTSQMRISIIVLMLISSISVFSQTSEQDRVNNTIVALFDGFAELSFEKVEQNSTSDIMILEHGEVWTMDTIRQKMTFFKSLNPTRVNSIKFLKTEITGNTAWVVYDNRAVITLNDQKYEYIWLESAVLVRSGNDWKIKMLHSTRLAPKQD